jgi:predicted methyltransferase
MRTLLVSSALILACGCSKQAPASNTAESIPNPVSVPAATGDDALAAAITAPTRKPENVKRDVYRHPKETLSFFGVRPGVNVIELWPGGGWYTEILAPLLHESGTLAAVTPTGNYLQPYKDFLASQPTVYDRVQLVEITPPGAISFGTDGAADVVVTFRNVHGWVNGGYAKQVHEAAFRALKPGGVFGVEEHRAKPGTSPEESAKSGYVSEEAEIALATAAGFVLEEKSEINANPADTKDYANGVWALPPSLRGGDVDKDKFLAIGESDRMTLRFKKPIQ